MRRMCCRTSHSVGVTAPLASSLAALAVPEKGRGLAVPGLGGLLEPSADLGGRRNCSTHPYAPNRLIANAFFDEAILPRWQYRVQCRVTAGSDSSHCKIIHPTSLSTLFHPL